MAFYLLDDSSPRNYVIAALGEPQDGDFVIDCDETTLLRGWHVVEVCDGLDNDCDTQIDEITDDAGFRDITDLDLYSWNPQPGATLYEVVQSTSPDFVSCTVSTTTDPFLIIPSAPAPSAASYYLVRSLTPNIGSWGKVSGPLPGAERVVPCVAP